MEAMRAAALNRKHSARTRRARNDAMRFLRQRIKPVRKDPADREKSAGAREYMARRHDRSAERLERAGDANGADAERAAAKQARRMER
jgi:hypothetical protein